MLNPLLLVSLEFLRDLEPERFLSIAGRDQPDPGSGRNEPGGRGLEMLEVKLEDWLEEVQRLAVLSCLSTVRYRRGRARRPGPPRHRP